MCGLFHHMLINCISISFTFFLPFKNFREVCIGFLGLKDLSKASDNARAILDQFYESP